ncbi:hypothetical protein F5X96DRAFT_666967 [Biscogniauxia mediterranea]|nr:hypothetical protein F5X96DRAFT_666967 [Biscogniauxia mediterranea]
MIWEWHFRAMLRPKVHRITSTKQLGSLSLPFGFVVDSYPRRQISSADRNITPESHAAARWVEQAYGTPEPLLGAVADHVRKTYGGLVHSSPWVESLLLSKHLTSGPDLTHIDWASDLLYIELANSSLDILFGAYKRRDNHPPPSWLAREGNDERAYALESLRELIIVVDRDPISAATRVPFSSSTSRVEALLESSVIWTPGSLGETFTISRRASYSSKVQFALGFAYIYFKSR